MNLNLPADVHSINCYAEDAKYSGDAIWAVTREKVFVLKVNVIVKFCEHDRITESRYVKWLKKMKRQTWCTMQLSYVILPRV